jgi:hypothetical protein
LTGSNAAIMATLRPARTFHHQRELILAPHYLPKVVW